MKAIRVALRKAISVLRNLSTVVSYRDFTLRSEDFFLRVLLQMRKMLRSGFSLSRYMEK